MRGMTDPARHIATTLPTPLAERWDRIQELNRQLADKLMRDEFPGLQELAAERNDLLVAFCHDYPVTDENAPTRARLLQQLIAENDRLMALGRGKLEETSDAGAATRHSRRAMAAYHAQSRTR
jgi:hypothetical protein